MIKARPASLLASLFALALGLSLSGGGCANGGGTASGPLDASDGPAPIDAAPETSSCPPPSTMCGTTCTNTANDPKNCGTCGMVCGASQVCSGSQCAYSCAPPETLCGMPPEGGAGDAALDASSDATVDATVDASDASSTLDASDDGGPAAPYCANLNNDNGNCGSCGNQCTGEHTCQPVTNPDGSQTGQCGLSCGAGQTACIAGDTCITQGTCCSSADCSVTGQVCPTPGGTCECPGGETVCPGINSCIGSSYCCTNADCASMAGATCPTPTGTLGSCQCTGGRQACLSTKSCIPETSCCTQAGECCDDPLGKSCGQATPQSTMALGKTINVQGGITATGEEDWIQVTFVNSDNTSFNGHIIFTANPNSEYVFDVAGDCLGTLLDCGEGGICQGKNEWQEYYNGGDPTGLSWKPISVGTVYIRVYRAVANSAPTCDQWALAISE